VWGFPVFHVGLGGGVLRMLLGVAPQQVLFAFYVDFYLAVGEVAALFSVAPVEFVVPFEVALVKQLFEVSPEIAVVRFIIKF
jgi:hypothetical protein